MQFFELIPLWDLWRGWQPFLGIAICFLLHCFQNIYDRFSLADKLPTAAQKTANQSINLLKIFCCHLFVMTHASSILPPLSIFWWGSWRLVPWVTQNYGRIELVIYHNQGFFLTIPENSLILTRIQLVLREPTLEIKPFESDTMVQSMR